MTKDEKRQAYQDKLDAKRERYEDRAEKARVASQAHYKASGEGLPPMGEPIKVGHHSESRHRAAIARSHRNMHRSIEESNKAAHYERKAARILMRSRSSN